MTRKMRSRGFTLVELMVVVAIIGLLAAVVTVNVMGQTYEARKVRCQSDFDNIGKALKLYKLAVGSYPRELRLLWERPDQAPKWAGPYLEPDDCPPRDPWGNEYAYQFSGGSDYEIISYGADGSPGGAEEDADLSNKTMGQNQQQQGG